MPRRERKQQPKRPKVPPKKRAKPRARKRNPRSSRMTAYARMLRDPCNAVLIPGLNTTDEGILSRLKTVTTPAYGAGNYYGYVLWFPHYVAKGGTLHENFLTVMTTIPSTPILNSVATPLGYASPGYNTVFTNTGASNFVSSDVCADFRLISACLKVTYYGPLNECKGQVGILENIPADIVLYGNNGGEPPTVDDLFARANQTTRMTPDGLEIKFRPEANYAQIFKNDAESVFLKGVPGTSATTLSADAKSRNPRGFGFVFKGVDINTLSLEVTQNIEWRPDADAGFTEETPRNLNPPGFVSSVLEYLDRTSPGWTSSFGQAASLAARLANAVYTGQ